MSMVGVLSSDDGWRVSIIPSLLLLLLFFFFFFFFLGVGFVVGREPFVVIKKKKKI
jgi:hypothetical protein